MKNKEIYKMNAIFNNEFIQSEFDNLIFGNHQISYKDNIIKSKNINSVRFSMCSSQTGSKGFYYFFCPNYYIDFIINKDNHKSILFQIMNSQMVPRLFMWCKENSIKIFDDLNIENIFNTYTDDVERYRYINRHFQKWAKNYNLDNPRENYYSTVKDYMNEVRPVEKPRVRDEIKLFFKVWFEYFKNLKYKFKKK